MSAAPTVKTTEPMVTAGFRPSFSVMVLAASAEMMQPTRVAETMSWGPYVAVNEEQDGMATGSARHKN